MKKYPIRELMIFQFIVIFIMGTTVLSAQNETASDSLSTPFRKGRWLSGLSGTISYDTNMVQGSDEESVTNQFGIDIATGKFIKDRWLLGGKFNISRSSSDGTFERNSETLYFGPFVNFYLTRNPRGSLFASLSSGYVSYREESTLNAPVAPVRIESEGGGFGILVGFGYSYAISDKIVFDIGFEFDTYWVNVDREGLVPTDVISDDLLVRNTAFVFGFNVILDDFFF